LLALTLTRLYAILTKQELSYRHIEIYTNINYIFVNITQLEKTKTKELKQQLEINGLLHNLI